MPDLGTILAALSVLAIVGAFLRFVWPKWHDFFVAVREVIFSLVGNDEIRDPRNPTRIIQPARPGLGVWMSTTDDALAVLSTAVTALADQQARFEVLEARVTILENGAIERIAARVDSTAAFDAIRAAQSATPHDDVPDPD